MTLTEEIESLLAELTQNNEVFLNKVQKIEIELSESDAFRLALRKGSKIPDFTLPNALGKPINVADIYKKKTLVIVFYRGIWCPFCNLQLRSLQKNLIEIENSPANLLAISMQSPDNSLSTAEKLELKFEVLSDEGGEVGKLFKLVYELPAYLHETYKKFGIDVEYYNGKGNIQLYYPATYIVNREGIIVNDYISASMSDRIDTQDIIRYLKENLSV
jgi:peroxiredoxin